MMMRLINAKLLIKALLFIFTLTPSGESELCSKTKTNGNIEFSLV